MSSPRGSRRANCAIFGACADAAGCVCSSLKRYGLELSTDLCFPTPSFRSPHPSLPYTVSLTLLKVDAVVTPAQTRASEVLLDNEVAYATNQLDRVTVFTLE